MSGMSKIFAFERDPYATELTVEVLQVERRANEWVVALDDTLLYPEGGGQPSDRGQLNEVPILRVEKSAAGPQHILEAEVERGRAVLTLDWQRRFDHMQQHTAQHILTRTALDRFGWQTRSFHIGPRVSDIELDCGPPRSQDIEALEDAVSRIIAEARPIRSYRVEAEELSSLDVRSRGLPADHRGDVRLVDIEGFDVNTCGGTHLASTAEVETLKVVGHEPLRGGCRLFWVAGKRVRTRLAWDEATMTELRTLLDTGDDDLVAGLRMRLDLLKRSKRDRRRLEKRLAEALFEALDAKAERLVDVHLEEAEAGVLRPLAELLARRGRQSLAFLTATDDAGVLFAVVKGETGADIDLQATGRTVAEILDGRGGGAGQFFQGKATSLESRPQAVERIHELLD